LKKKPKDERRRVQWTRSNKTRRKCNGKRDGSGEIRGNM
jgi:hypothetical protein